MGGCAARAVAQPSLHVGALGFPVRGRQWPAQDHDQGLGWHRRGDDRGSPATIAGRRDRLARSHRNGSRRVSLRS